MFMWFKMPDKQIPKYFNVIFSVIIVIVTQFHIQKKDLFKENTLLDYEPMRTNKN